MPPYYAFLAVLGLSLGLGAVSADGREFLSSLVFLRNYYGRVGGWFTSHFWSLAVEEHFYLIWPGLLVLLATSRRAAWAALGLGVLVRAWRSIDLHYAIGPRYLGLPLIGAEQRTDVCLDGLFFGCLLALIVESDRGRTRLARLINPPVWSVLFATFLATVVLDFRFPFSGHLISVLIPLLVVGTVLHPRSLPGRVLEWGPARAIGRLSYSLYLWQPFLGTIAVPRWPGRSEAGAPPIRAGLAMLQRFPINWIACFACALLSYRFIEKPMIAVGRRLAARRKAGAPAPGGPTSP